MGEALFFRGDIVSINVSCNDMFEVEFLDSKNESKVEFCGTLDWAKEFVRNSLAKEHSVLSVTYFIELMISETNSHMARQPHRKFAEHQFTPQEFLTVPDAWVNDARITANKEIDSYMADRFGATLLT
jgi:hypothetical protein